MKKNANVSRSIVATVFILAFSSPIMAQTVIDGSDIEEIVNIAKGYGSATLQYNDDGEPGVRGRIEGNPYYLSFRNCSSDTACEDFYFQSFFIKPVVDYELANEWNYENRWTKLYFDNVDDATLEMDVNLGGGITLTNLEQAFSIWSQHMKLFYDDYLEKK